MNDAVHQRSSAPRGDAVAGPLLLGIDLGTSALKCGLFGLDGTRVAAARVPYPLQYAATGGEQDASDWWDALVKAVGLVTSQVDSNTIGAIAIGGHAPSPVFVDKDLRPVWPVVPWLDNRAREHAKQIIQTLGRPPSGGPERLMVQTAARAMWLRSNAPDNFAQVHCVLHSGDYLIARLTGRRVMTSPKVPEIFRAAGLPLHFLPEVEAEPGSIVGSILGDVAQQLGLEAAVPVVAAGLDSFLAAIGAGVCEPGDACLTSGCSAGVALVAPAPRSGRFQWGEHQVLSQPCKVGGRALEWVYGAANTDASLAALLVRAAEQEPSAANFRFAADLMEQSAHGDACVREMVSTMAVQCNTIELLRTVLDAIFLSQQNTLHQMELEAGEARRILAVGGLAACPQIVQLQADILGRPIEVPNVVESGTLGAAMLAAVALGFYSPREASLRMVRSNQTYYPRRDVAAAYAQFADAVPSLSPR